MAVFREVRRQLKKTESDDAPDRADEDVADVEELEEQLDHRAEVLAHRLPRVL